MIAAFAPTPRSLTLNEINGSQSELIASAHSKLELVITDGLCPKIAELSSGAHHPLIALGRSASPLAAISTALQSQRLHGEQVDTLHIVAHGRPGAFCIGGQWIDQSSLTNNADLLSEWNVSTIALWSCEVGANAGFVALLAELTGATIFSSKQTIGSRESIDTTNWTLRSTDGGQLTAAPFNATALNGWGHTLAQVTVSGLYKATVSYVPTGFFGEETSRIDINTTPFSTTNVTFTQAGAKFSGNNVLGTIGYGSGSTINNANASRPDVTPFVGPVLMRVGGRGHAAAPC